MPGHETSSISSVRKVRVPVHLEKCSVLGIGRSYIPLAHALSPVLHTASRRALRVYVLTQVLRPCGRFLERVAHCIGDGTRICRHERVDVRVYQRSAPAVGGRGHTRATVVCTLHMAMSPRLSRRAWPSSSAGLSGVRFVCISHFVVIRHHKVRPVPQCPVQLETCRSRATPMPAAVASGGSS